MARAAVRAAWQKLPLTFASLTGGTCWSTQREALLLLFFTPCLRAACVGLGKHLLIPLLTPCLSPYPFPSPPCASPLTRYVLVDAWRDLGKLDTKYTSQYKGERFDLTLRNTLRQVRPKGRAGRVEAARITSPDLSLRASAVILTHLLAG